MPTNPVPFALGLLVGFLTRPLIMGCFGSKPLPEPAAKQPSPAARAPAPESAPVASERVVSVPRPAVAVTDRDRAELKAKSLRDKLSVFVLQSDDEIRRYGLEAVAAKRAGHLTSARLYMQRRALLLKRTDATQARAKQALDMVAAIEDAKDNLRTLDAIAEGTRMINEAMEGMDREKVEGVLEENRDALEMVKEVNRMLGGEEDMPDDEFDAMMDALEREQAGGEVEAPAVEEAVVEHAAGAGEEHGLAHVDNIPDVPVEVPQEPVVAEHELAEHVEEYEEIVEHVEEYEENVDEVTPVEA